jgi:hypothetical protein
VGLWAGILDFKLFDLPVLRYRALVCGIGARGLELRP